MAGSFMARLRERMEQLQSELQPEGDFDRRAYGYGDDTGAEDATFEEVALEEESPWRRSGSGEPPAPSAASAPDAGREESPWHRPEAVPPPAPPRPVTRAARAESFDPFGVRERQTGGGARRAPPPRPSREAPAPTPGAPGTGVRSTPREHDRTAARGAGRLQRLRRRIRNPDSLRELFLLREVIDRPIALRRPRPPTRPSS